MRRDFLLFARATAAARRQCLTPSRPSNQRRSHGGSGAHPRRRRLTRRTARLTVASPIARLTVADRGANPPSSPTLRINKFYVVSRPLLARYLRADGKHIGPVN